MASDKQGKLEILSNLNGGLSTRNAPLIIENGVEQAMKSPSLLNVDFFNGGAVAKRLGKTKQNTAQIVGTTVWQSNTTAPSRTPTGIRAGTGSGTTGIFQKVVAGSNQNIYSLTLKMALHTAGTGSNYTNLTAVIMSNSGSAPGVVLASSTVILDATILTTTLANITFSFPAPYAAVSGTTYWFGLTFNATDLNGIDFSYNGTGSSGRVYWYNNNITSYVPLAYDDLYYSISGQAASLSVNGLYDYHFGSASTQKVIAAGAGGIYYSNAGTSWTSIQSGLASAANSIFSFATLNNFLYSSDYGTNPSRVWDGNAAYTIHLGVRPVGTFVNSATGGTVTTGTYKVLLVTTMTSGGFRSSIEYTVTTTTTTDKIAASAVVVNNTGATDFGFDAGTACTEVFMTLLGGSTYYKLATGSVSVGNPLPNGTTAFNITAPPAGTENTLLLEYTKEQGYFTSQVASPTNKYLCIFQNMLCAAGDAAKPCRVWFSGLGTPQIWSTRGGIEGNYLDLDVNDGDFITGIRQWNGNLYAFKRHSVYIIQYTGVASSPFVQKRLASNFGAISHWSIKDIGSNGLMFLSERGPAVCLGTYVLPVAATNDILDRFNSSSATSYNLASMNVSTCGLNATKSQIWWGVSSHSATTSDMTLVYDYEKQVFWENDCSSNVYAEVLDSNFFTHIWSAGYDGYVYQQDTGLDDNGAAINFYFDTPLMQLGDPFYYKQMNQVFIAGTVQSSGNLYVDVFTENSNTPIQTLTFDMTNATFKSGQSVTCQQKGRMFRFRLRNSDLDIPVQIDSIGLNWVQLNSQY